MTTIELGATVTYNGVPGEVVGFGSLCAGYAAWQHTDTTAFVVRVAHGPHRILRHLPLEVLR
jgi:hypothetical protein